MNRVGKAISQVVKSFRKMRQDLDFVYNLKASENSEERDYKDPETQADIEKTKKSLMKRKASIKQGVDVLFKKIDDALRILEEF